MWALVLVGAAACEHKDAPKATTAAATTARVEAAAEVDVDGGAAVATKLPATTGAAVAHVAADGGVAAAAASGAAPAGPLRIRPPMDRTEQGLRGTRIPGIMPRGGLDRGMLLNRPAPLSSSVQPPAAAQKQ